MRYQIQLEEICNLDSNLAEKLLSIWESSVRATHLILSDEEIEQIKKYVPQALEGVEHLVLATAETGAPVGFMGVDGERLEMLFISPNERGNGIGKRLVLYGIKNYHINEVTVNEQNPQAVGFYEHMGFKVYKRTACDEQGGPYPLLYMKLKK